MDAKQFKGQALSWQMQSGVVELALHRDPCNELGSLSLLELEKFAAALDDLEKEAHALILYSELKCGFCAGADLRELYERSQSMAKSEAARGVRDFLERIHRVLNRIDAVTPDHDCGSSRRDIRWRIRTCLGMRFDRRR